MNHFEGTMSQGQNVYAVARVVNDLEQYKYNKIIK
jgi:hypothetical protein